MSIYVSSSTRPEHAAPPELFYGGVAAKKYATNTRVLEIQTEMANRAIELLALPEDACPKYLLDIGCGSGISGNCLSEAGNVWVGVDISRDMLDIANESMVEDPTSANGSDLLHADMGNGLPFRLGSFDGAISISAVQWLCNADRKSHEPLKRLQKFFGTLYKCLRKGARAVFQFYPETPEQTELITNMAMKAGFGGGLVIDYPHSRKIRKYYLVLFAGMPNIPKSEIPKGREDPVSQHVKNENSRNASSSSGKKRKNLKEFIIKKKERDRKLGKEVRPPSKYTARSRGPKF
ncbi:hypothetical protein NAEGRDRAFT_58357 [Naegleria gruberi]|uniref:Methyltransferase n=1 Tax=Naegleria gruberi TaxID=5762 RepID=D2VJ19_NAEGR|nr:uncharacterized protein NAEGRDRAFT_58357 [Naegleria gruberi]EFC43198.1 hypothetical protein NAEGRDRAFT_58357 [Naegleria gruberi]|eukprot:XP_002675942.1 hypothetical protein NAEGRDRAFT_58357 [Naegleria gruberi strain NEG-M]